MPSVVNVPNAPGVPPVLFNPLTAFVPSLMTEDSYAYFGDTFGPQWGIFVGGQAIITADTVLAFDYRQEWVVADYPLEEGSFESYDKVATPFQGRFQFAAGGTQANREALLASIAAIAGDLNLYDIVTPEVIAPNVNVTHYDYRRTALSGRGLLVIDVWVNEIRVQANPSGATVSPSGAGHAITRLDALLPWNWAPQPHRMAA